LLDCLTTRAAGQFRISSHTITALEFGW